jgi:carnitine O-acetyltransferase
MVFFDLFCMAPFNRPWDRFDKPANFVIFDNNQAGVVGEHSIMDGTPMARMCDEMVEDLHSQSFDHGPPAAASLVSPQPLDWNITPALSQAISSATDEGKALVNTQTMGYHLTQYGKEAIKKYGVSPDSWAQMLIQLAYYRLIGPRKPGGTYEAATTRRFIKGRTETIRTVTVESEAWLRAMHDATVDDITRRELFTEATKVHIRDAREAGKAQGIDRHLLGMPLIGKGCFLLLINFDYRFKVPLTRGRKGEGRDFLRPGVHTS